VTGRGAAPAPGPNPKSVAWDRLGALFWTHGRPSARPDGSTIDLLLDGFGPGTSLLVVGASTRGLVAGALERRVAVTVVDFSAGMCRALEAEFPAGSVVVRQADVTGDCADVGPARFAGVLSERLVNRFTTEEADLALRSMALLARPGGEIRLTLKHGFYPMDLRLVEIGRRSGTVDRFYDEQTRTLDYPAAGELLEAALVPHGEIPAELLLEWYRGRGRERRWMPGDLEELARGVPGLHLRRRVPVAEDCCLYVFGVWT
jgi:hypothetical protein